MGTTVTHLWLVLGIWAVPIPRAAAISAVLQGQEAGNPTVLSSQIADEIQLEPGDAIDPERGHYRELTYRAPAAGKIYVYARSSEVDPALVCVSRAAGSTQPATLESEDEGGGTTAFLEIPVKLDQPLELRVFGRGLERRSTVSLHISLAEESSSTKAHALGIYRELQALKLDSSSKPSQEVSERLSEMLDRLLPNLSDPISPTILFVAWKFTEVPQHFRDVDLELKARGIIHAFWERHLPSTHPRLLNAMIILAVSLKNSGRLDEARGIEREILEQQLELNPADSTEVRSARLNYASTLYRLGDLDEATKIFEGLYEDVRSLDEGDPFLLAVQQNYAATLLQRGYASDAEEIYGEVIRALVRLRPQEELQIAHVRRNYGRALVSLGQPERAKDIQEEVLRAFTAGLPANDPQILRSKLFYADVLKELGDLQAARVLEEQVLERQQETLAEDHVDLETTRQVLGVTLYALGEYEAARQLFEKVVTARSERMSQNHPELLSNRLNLAKTIGQLGEVREAQAHLRQIIEEFPDELSETLDLLVAKDALAWTYSREGELGRALELQEAVLEGLGRMRPETDPALQRARGNLAWTLVRKGDYDETARLVGDMIGATKRRLTELGPQLGPREIEALTSQSETDLSEALSLLIEARNPEWSAELEDKLFDLVETTRASGATQRRLARELGRVEDDPGIKEILEADRAASAEVVRCSSAGGLELFEAIRKRDDTQRELLSHLSSLPDIADSLPRTGPNAISAALESDEVAVGFWRYERTGIDPETKRLEPEVSHYLAYVLRQGDSLERVELGPARPIDAAIERWRSSLLDEASGSELRGIRPLGDSKHQQEGTGMELRRLVFDPLREALGDARRLFVAMDDRLHLIPLDALPVDSERVLGDLLRVVACTSLKELTRPGGQSAEPSLLAMGGMNYDLDPSAIRSDEDTAAGEHSNANESVEIDRRLPTLAHRGAPASVLRSPSWRPTFEFLAATQPEVEALAESFRDAFPETSPTVLTDRAASREAFERLAPEVSFLHLATHAYLAPDLIPSMDDLERSSPRGPLSAGPYEHVRGFAPMLLCGLAFAGANSEANELGLLEHVMTADELANLDLSGCELAVLSACETNVGLLRAGQGVASLQRALHAAGARSMVTSLWKVPDGPTTELMTHFYRELWVNQRTKADALWEAKHQLRKQVDSEGRPRYTTRDWAAWVLSGDPD